MKRLLLSITLSLIISCSFAQWEWQNPLPQGNTITALSFIDEDNGCAVGWGTIMTTTDGGLTWNVKESDFGEGYNDLMLTDVCFTDAMNGWIAGGMPGFIFHTTDGGQTWSGIPHENTRLPSAKTDIFFIEQLKGWVLGWSAAFGGVYIQRTVDGGITWDIFDVCEGASPYDGGIYFVNSTDGWVTWGNKIMHTIDGGITWEIQFEERSIELTDIYFSDFEHGWAVGSETVLITENGGETWVHSQDTLLVGKMLNTVSFISNTTGWCGGMYNIDEKDNYNGAILKSLDGGFTWENQLSNNFIDPILCLNHMGSNAIAAGANGLILRAIDEGNGWNKISSTVSNCDFMDVSFADDLNGWACGSNSTGSSTLPNPAIYHTIDGGSIWSEQLIDNELDGVYYKIFFSDNMHGWALGNLDKGRWENQLINTVNGGESWEIQSTENIANDIYFINNVIGWRIGDFGAIQKSEDGGWNWEDQNSGTYKNLYSLIFIDEENGWIAGDSVVLHTSDGGQSWVEQSAGLYPWANIFFMDEQNGWVTYPGWGYGSGRTMRTLDGGQSWEEINELGFHEIIFLDADIGWGRGRTDPGGGVSSPPAYNIRYTNDGGLTWEVQHTPVLIEGGFCFVNENNGWAVSRNGAILHTNNNGASEVAEHQLHNSVLVANTQPNPFSSRTTLSYALSQPSTVQLSIYNQLGQLVYQHSEEQQKGEQKLQWDAQGLADGIYYYRLQVGDAVANGKMVKVR